MMRTLRIVLLLVALFLVSDGLLYVIEHRLFMAYTASFSNDPWQSSTFELARFTSYTTVFGVTGAILAWYIPVRRMTLLMAFGLGIALPASSLLFEQAHPWFYQDHGVNWQIFLLSWANWWLPPLACWLGALMSARFFSKLGRE